MAASPEVPSYQQEVVEQALTNPNFVEIAVKAKVCHDLHPLWQLRTREACCGHTRDDIALSATSQALRWALHAAVGSA